jgi:Holliday junction resolvase YEN1
VSSVCKSFSQDLNVIFEIGDHSVIRPNMKDAGDNIFLYTSDAIQSHPKVSLTREGLFLLAILNGGDYDPVCFLFISRCLCFIHLQVGLAGCGSTIAHKLAQSDLARTLFHATLGLPSEALSEFLADWRQKLKHQLAYDSNGLLGRKHPAVARKVSSEFPSINILLLYANPVTSWTADIIPDSSQWRMRQPDLPAIGLLCEKSFSWGTSGQMIARFQQNVWRGIVMRYLLQIIDLIRQY